MPEDKGRVIMLPSQLAGIFTTADRLVKLHAEKVRIRRINEVVFKAEALDLAWLDGLVQIAAIEACNQAYTPVIEYVPWIAHTHYDVDGTTVGAFGDEGGVEVRDNMVDHAAEQGFDHAGAADADEEDEEPYGDDHQANTGVVSGEPHDHDYHDDGGDQKEEDSGQLQEVHLKDKCIELVKYLLRYYKSPAGDLLYKRCKERLARQEARASGAQGNDATSGRRGEGRHADDRTDDEGGFTSHGEDPYTPMSADESDTTPLDRQYSNVSATPSIDSTTSADGWTPASTAQGTSDAANNALVQHAALHTDQALRKHTPLGSISEKRQPQHKWGALEPMNTQMVRRAGGPAEQDSDIFGRKKLYDMYVVVSEIDSKGQFIKQLVSQSQAVPGRSTTCMHVCVYVYVSM
jgi:hypothetical protein